METLVLPYQPVRYLVTNTEKIILVTHDFKYANKIAGAISKLENPKVYYPKIA
jgi:ABC-type polar amino acid transport system ATPase subunit